jgi:hypothetical protein
MKKINKVQDVIKEIMNQYKRTTIWLNDSKHKDTDIIHNNLRWREATITHSLPISEELLHADEHITYTKVHYS